MLSLFMVTDILLGFLQNMMIVYGIMSLLFFFNVLNPHGRIVGAFWQILVGLFEPLLQPIRRLIPSMRGFDWSFMILYLLIVLVRSLLHEYGPLGVDAVNSLVS